MFLYAKSFVFCEDLSSWVKNAFLKISESEIRNKFIELLKDLSMR